jgi:hypothetical protein
MPLTHALIRHRNSILSATALVAGVLASNSFAPAEEKLAEPVYRVANETPAAQPAATPATQVSSVKASAAYDFTQQPGEHPLAPVIRSLKASQEEIDRNIRDYSCTLVKREFVDGALGEYQHIDMKIQHQPFSVYMKFLKPFEGREVLYVDGQNNGSMIVLDAGIKRMLGKMTLDPKGALAMRGQRHPITDVGIRNLTEKLIKRWEAESQFAECEVTSNPDMKISGRKTTMVQVLHPVPRQNFQFHIARLFYDNELRIPIHFDAFSWPAQANGPPQPEESYTYTGLKINNSFPASAFDANNPELFK